MKRSTSSEPAVSSKRVKSTPEPVLLHRNSKNNGKYKLGKKSSPDKKEFKSARLENSKHIKEEIKKEKRSPDPAKRKPIIKIKNKLDKKKIFQKKVKNFNKGKKSLKTGISAVLIGKDGKPEWNKIKEGKKSLKEKRKLHRTGEQQYQLSVRAKSIWEILRVKKLTPEKREAYVNELFMLLKGHIPNVVHSHDMARVVQWMLKLGSQSVRTSICEQLSADVSSYLQSKYASFCVRRALRYASKTDRNHLIQACYGHFLKLLGHSFASPVIEKMYVKYATGEQRKRMHKELYGEMHSLLPPEVHTIDRVPEDLRPSIISATKTNLSKLLCKKELLESTLLQSVLNDFLSNCSEQDGSELVELIQGDIAQLLNTKEGSRVALLVVWNATNKVKKQIVKSIKGKVKEIASSENGHVFLMALFDSIDDTVLVKKALIPELLKEAEDIAKDELGRKVILYLVAHRDPAYFHPQQIEIFSKGDNISKRKKDVTVRKQEMLEAVSDPLLQKIAAQPANWIGESSIAMVSLAVMKSGKGDALQAAFDSLVDYLLDPRSLIEVENRHVHVVEHSAVHLVFKKLIHQDQSQPERTHDSLSKILAKKLTEESLNHILQFNRGCFLLVQLFESKNKEVCKKLKSKITEPMTTFLRKQETTGSKILLKKLQE